MSKHYLLEQADKYLTAADKCSLRGDKKGEIIATRLAIIRLKAFERTTKVNRQE